METILHVVEFPFIWILYLTATPVSDEHYDKTRLLICPTTILLFYMYIFHPLSSLEYQDVLISLSPIPVGLFISVVFYFVLEKDKPPSWSIVFCVLGVLSGLMWTYLLIGILIDLLNTLGLILNLEKAYLGLTILAIGNALPDALTTFSLI